METVDSSVDMVEDVGLDMLIVHPGGGGGEAIDFKRQAGRSRIKLAHHGGGAGRGADVGAFGQVSFEVVAKQPQVDLPAVGRRISQSLIRELRQFIGRQKPHCVYVDIKRTLDAPGSEFTHTLPVLE